MRILHIGNNICGIPNALVRAERESGHAGETISFVPDYQGHKSDMDYDEPSRIRRFIHLLLLLKQYDVFVFTGDSIFWGTDILFWKMLGRKVAIHYHGMEIRGRGIRFFHRFADALFVSTPDLLEFAPRAVWLPNPIFIEDYPKSEAKRMVIAHSTTNRSYSGTKYVIKAFEGVKNRFPSAELDIIEGIPYKETIEHYRKATIMIDKISTIVGWYGMVALECMAMEVPVVCYIRDDLKEYIENTGFSPVWYTDKYSIGQDLIMALSSGGTLNVQVQNGYEYVKTVHNPKRCVNIILNSLGVKQ
jgi:hypothetical protein